MARSGGVIIPEGPSLPTGDMWVPMDSRPPKGALQTPAPTGAGSVRAAVLDWLAGGGVGLLLGLLVGLSVSPVVATVVGALAALLVSLFGLGLSGAGKKRQPDGEPRQEPLTSRGRPHRMAAFGLLAVAGLGAGLLLRTHDGLSPSVTDQVREWEAAGYPAKTARGIVAFRRAGVVLRGSGVAAVSGEPAASPDRSGSSLLMAGPAAEECDDLDPRDFGATEELTAAFDRTGGAWRAVALAVETLPDADQRSILEAAWELACS